MITVDFIYFLPIDVKIANNSLHSSYSADICFLVFHPTSNITFNQNCVSLASLSHIEILFLKSALLRDRFASR